MMIFILGSAGSVKHEVYDLNSLITSLEEF